MPEVEENSKSKQIKTLLYVVGAGVIAAAALSLSMLYYYNPTGAYSAENVLLAPEAAYGLNYSDSSKVKGKVRFDRIEFEYWEVSTRKSKMVMVDKENYAAFYNLVKGITSVVNPDEAIVSRFGVGHPAKLVIKVMEDGKTANIFSQVEFAEDSDFFRVKLRQQGSGTSWEWAYFSSPGMYRKVMQIMNNERR